MPDRPADLDEEAVLDELYGLRPDHFTAARITALRGWCPIVRWHV